MTQEEFKTIEKVKRDIERFENILDFRKKYSRTGYAFPMPSVSSIDPIIYSINDDDVNAAIDKLIKEKLEEKRQIFNRFKVI